MKRARRLRRRGDLSTSSDVFIWRHWFSFFFLFFLLGLASQSSPPVSLSPLKAAGPWPLQRRPSKPSSFQPRRQKEPPLFPPTGNIPFSRGDNFIHLVRHCIQLNAESYGDTRVNWASVRACVCWETGRCYVSIFSVLTENQRESATQICFLVESKTPKSHCSRAILNFFADDQLVSLVIVWKIPLQISVFFPCLFSSGWLSSPVPPRADRQLSGTVWAYFHLPNTKTAVGPPCSSLIIHIQARASWQVCWSHSMFCDSDNTFSLCGQKNAEAITLLRAGLVRLNWGRSCELFCESYGRR